MNTPIWIIQGLLAAFFLVPAFTKLLLSKEKLIEKKVLEEGQPLIAPRLIGLFELLGSIGIIVPWLTNIFPILTPLSAVGFALIMLGATGVHYKKKEYKMIPLLLIVMMLSLVVAWYRF